jgi:hypothetical protein
MKPNSCTNHAYTIPKYQKLVYWNVETTWLIIPKLVELEYTSGCPRNEINVENKMGSPPPAESKMKY